MSHMINGRTYRNVLTTNDQKPTGQGEPQKLNIITSSVPDKEAEAKGQPKGVVPFAIPKPEGWHPEGTDLSKMITTHDEPGKVRVEIDPNAGPGPAKFMDDAFKADAAGTPKKKAGRPKKE